VETLLQTTGWNLTQIRKRLQLIQTSQQLITKKKMREPEVEYTLETTTFITWKFTSQKR
jgi:hypothetical protein